MTGRITWTSSGEAHSGQPGGYLVQKALHVERIASGTQEYMAWKCYVGDRYVDLGAAGTVDAAKAIAERHAASLASA